MTLAAYNAGDDAVRRVNGVPLYRETIDYVKFVNEIYQLLKLRSENVTYGKSSVISSDVTKTQNGDPPTAQIDQSITCSSAPGSVEPQH